MSLWFVEDIWEDPPELVFGGDDVGADAEGVGEAPHAKVLAGVVLAMKVSVKFLLLKDGEVTWKCT
jgi:hypothetical protein